MHYPLRHVAVLLGLTLLAAQPATAARDETGVWSIVSTSDALPGAAGDSGWRYAVDAQARYFDLGSGVNQYLLRPSIGYQANDNLQVWLGYGRFRTRTAAGRTVDENRWFQQFNWTVGNPGPGTITMRARLLQRSLSNGDDTSLTLRWLTQYQQPLGDSGRRHLIVSFEPWLDMRDTDWGGDSGLTQHRAYLGVGWTLSDRLQLDTGYMNQFFWLENARNVSNHLAMLHLKFRL